MTTRRLAAILAADVAGFSAMMERDEEGTAARIRALRRDVIEPALGRHHGRLVKTTGDGFLAEFASPVEAVRSALAIQDQLASANGVSVRIGINLGDIIIEDDGDVFGDGVNVAARLEQIAEPGGIVISGWVHDQIIGKVERPFEDRGEQQVKNIVRPVRVYALAGAVPSRPESKALPLPDKPSIAVLPFANMSDDPEQDYFADGLTDEITTALSRLRSFYVIARNSAFTYKGRSIGVRQIGRELGVRYVLEGSIRRAGQRVRITGQLVETSTGIQLWGDRYEGPLADVFELQDLITRSVVGAIEPRVRAAEIDRVRRKPTGDLGAYDLFLRSLSELHTYSAEGLARADYLLRAAIERDPDYADALATLAHLSCLRMVGGFLDRPQARETAVPAALKGVDADPQNPFTLASAAAALTVLGSNLDQATEFADQAVALAPTSAAICLLCAYPYNFGGAFERALGLLHSARRLSPRDPRSFMVVSQITHSHLFLRDYEAAILWGARGVEEHPFFTPVRRYLIAALAHAGRLREAQHHVAELVRTQPNSTLTRAANNPWRYPWMVELYVSGLRKAGLPE